MTTRLFVPTEHEQTLLQSFLPARFHEMFRTVGFGPVHAGILSAEILANETPRRVIIVGIAGLFDEGSDGRQIGEACWFDCVQVDGIGVGQGEAFRDPQQLGWDKRFRIPAAIPCALPPGKSSGTALLTVCSCSATAQEAAWRSQRFPGVIGEDMESYSIALACQRAEISCSVLRGFSNRVGCRDPKRWDVETALESVADALQAEFPHL